MLDAISPSNAGAVAPPPVRVAVSGRAEVSFVRSDGRTRVARNFSADPLRLLFPRPEPGQPVTAVAVTTSGGLVGGDDLAVGVSADPDSEALVMTQAAEKVYRSAGPDALVDVELDGKTGSWLEWLPHETILFDGARLNRRMRIDLSSRARLLTGEFLVFGRSASGETLTSCYLRDSWEVRRDERLIWADAFQVDGDWQRVTRAAAGLAGAKAMATIVCAAAEPELVRAEVRGLLDERRPTGLRCGVTTIEGLVIVRLMGGKPQALRRVFAGVWGRMRLVAGGFGESLPRLWHI